MIAITVERPAGSVTPRPDAPRRKLRLFANERPRVFGDLPGLGFILEEGSTPPAQDSIRIPGTPNVLTRGEPTQITVFNRLRTPLAVHWHGMELESYFDGVPDFSGDPGRTIPAIQPGDSFVVHMTPPRALLFVPSNGGPGDSFRIIFINGTKNPAPIEMRAHARRCGDHQGLRVHADGGRRSRPRGGSADPRLRDEAADSRTATEYGLRNFSGPPRGGSLEEPSVERIKDPVLFEPGF